MCRYGDIRLNLDPQFASQWNTNKKQLTSWIYIQYCLHQSRYSWATTITEVWRYNNVGVYLLVHFFECLLSNAKHILKEWLAAFSFEKEACAQEARSGNAKQCCWHVWIWLDTRRHTITYNGWPCHGLTTRPVTNLCPPPINCSMHPILTSSLAQLCRLGAYYIMWYGSYIHNLV